MGSYNALLSLFNITAEEVKGEVTKTLLLIIANNHYKILYFMFLRNFSFCSVAHISLILSLRIVSMETKKKSTFKVLFYLKKNAPKNKGQRQRLFVTERVGTAHNIQL